MLEYYLIRLALWTASRPGAPIPMRPVATACADVLLSALALATLRAYRDDTIDVPERWVAALDALLAE